jgi:hypothetical protein
MKLPRSLLPALVLLLLQLFLWPFIWLYEDLRKADSIHPFLLSICLPVLVLSSIGAFHWLHKEGLSGNRLAIVSIVIADVVIVALGFALAYWYLASHPLDWSQYHF